MPRKFRERHLISVHEFCNPPGLMIDPLSDDIKVFILEYIDSVGQLELLILLAKNPAQTWSVGAVTLELRSTIDYVTLQLENLCKKKLISKEEDGTFVFAPSEPQVAAVINRLQSLYYERRVSIINIIYNKPGELIQGLADAFKVRKEDADG